MAANNVAIPFVVVGHGAATALLDRQAGLTAVQRLNLALFVSAQNDRVLRKVQVKSHDHIQLLRKPRIVADLESPQQMWLQTVGMPYTPYRDCTQARCSRHRSGGPVRGIERLFLVL
jgi:hypothetical protein